MQRMLGLYGLMGGWFVGGDVGGSGHSCEGVERMSSAGGWVVVKCAWICV